MEDYFYIVEKSYLNEKEKEISFNLKDTQNISLKYFNELKSKNEKNIKDKFQSLIIYEFKVINPNIELKEDIINMIDSYKDLNIDVFRYPELFDFELIEQIPLIIEQKYQIKELNKFLDLKIGIKDIIKEKQDILDKKTQKNININKERRSI